MSIFRKIINLINDLPALPKSLYVNLKAFPLKDALKLPLWVAPQTKLGTITKGCIRIEAPLRRKMIRFGFQGVSGIPGNSKGYLAIEKTAQITFKQYAFFAEGSTLRVDGSIYFGNNFSINNCSYISCSHTMHFGDNVLIGWHVHIRDTDGHTVIDSNGTPKPCKKPITIGNHVWIGAFSHILRGVVIPDNSIVAYRSTVLHSFEESNCVIGGYPAKVIQKDINWKE